MSTADARPDAHANTQSRHEGDFAIDGHDIELHPPELYERDAVAEPLPGLEAFEEQHVEVYHSQGFLAIENVLTSHEVEQAVAGMTDLILGKQPDFRGVMYEAKGAEKLAELTPAQRMDRVRKLNAFVDHEPRLKALAEKPALHAVLRQLMRGREPELYKNQALIKPPRIGREKPWHQDGAYFNVTPDTPVVGVWIALDAATPANGCMHMLAGGHQQGPIPHWRRRDWQICDTDIHAMHETDRPIVAVPLSPGGAVLFTGLTPHGTPHNNSEQRRRALQFHYKPVDAVEGSREQRLDIWGTEGKDVEC